MVNASSFVWSKLCKYLKNSSQELRVDRRKRLYSKLNYLHPGRVRMHIPRYASSSSNKEKPEAGINNYHHVFIHEDEHLHQGKINGVSSESMVKMNGPDHRGAPIRSNLKKTLLHEETNQISSGIRRVTWPDAHGKDLAHVQEFKPSMSDDGELASVRKSCKRNSVKMEKTIALSPLTTKSKNQTAQWFSTRV